MGRERRDLRSLSLSLYGDREGGGGGARGKKNVLFYIFQAHFATLLQQFLMPLCRREYWSAKVFAGLLSNENCVVFFAKKK